ncbi:MAG: helix-turn-helix domain-containing protein [Zunongwangia sp.]|uniref:helix-turn-helix domain-containing protein n=1 Tax=Zunongwangia sp. TaxID=1965325 RepID=UPI003242958C
MKNSKLSERVTELRNRKGFSQEVLAEDSGLSLRTIQRIENGETTPRGDTLQRIAKGLGVTSEELIDWKLEKNDSYLALLNISALSFIIFPLLGIIIPIVMWISKRKEVSKVDKIGKQVINFQITWCLFIFLIYIFSFLSFMFHLSIFPRITLFRILMTGAFLFLFNIIQVIMNTLKVKKGRHARYYLSIPFLR